MKIDKELKNLISTNKTEYNNLENSLLLEGCHDPLIVWKEEDILLDGHNRYEICNKNNIKYAIKEMSLATRLDAMIWIREHQLSRRNLTDDQRAINAAELSNLLAKKSNEAKAKKAVDVREGILGNTVSPKIEEPKERVNEKISKDTKISVRQIKYAQQVIKDSPETAKKVQDGDIKLLDAVRDIKRKEIINKLEDIKEKEVKAIQGVYDVVVLDPPWQMEKIERDVAPTQVNFDYPTMSEDELNNLKVPCADDCHVWMWTTHKHLPMAFRLLEKWNLKYVCTFVWHKNGGFQAVGLPQYNCEFVLYARKGTPKFIDTKAFNTCFSADRTGHSEKPDAFYDIVRRVTAGRRIDMFNRREIKGFDTYGNEAK